MPTLKTKVKERTYLNERREKEFQLWYKGVSVQNKQDPNPDHPLHRYDWRGAFKAGIKPDDDEHWSSQHKLKGHPRLIVDGVNTKTGQREK